jgi:hypothetical protein
MAAEFGSTGALAMLVFQALVDGNGTNPFRFPLMPSVVGVPSEMPAQVWAHAVPLKRIKMLKTNNAFNSKQDFIKAKFNRGVSIRSP